MNTPSNQKRTILAVDDDSDFLAQLQLQLKASGFNVITAGSLQEADQTLAAQTPDLVIADLMLEYMDAGFVLCHRVKKKNPKTPVILLTGVTHETGINFEGTYGDEGRWIKADAILEKPVRAEQLKREIAKLLD